MIKGSNLQRQCQGIAWTLGVLLTVQNSTYSPYLSLPLSQLL